jgi:hypothetical protein
MTKPPDLQHDTIFMRGLHDGESLEDIGDGSVTPEQYFELVRATPVAPWLIERLTGFTEFLGEHADELDAEGDKASSRGTDLYCAASVLLKAKTTEFEAPTKGGGPSPAYVAQLKAQGVKPYLIGEDEVEALREKGRQDGVVTLASVTPERVTWLWKDRIPEHKLCTIQGDPEEGKSTVALDLAARLSMGRSMPDGGGKLEPMDVLVMSAEDGTADTIVPRLMAAGADLARCHQWKAVPRYSDEGLLIREDGIMLPNDLLELEKHIGNYSARFVIIDPLNAFVFSGDGNKDPLMRQALTPIGSMAERLGATVIGIRHLNKSGGTNVKYRGSGTIAVTAAVRSEITCAPDQEDETGQTRILLCTKHNLGPPSLGLRYRMEPSGPYGSIRVVWGDAVAITGTELLAGPRQPSEADKVAAFLREALANGEWQEVRSLQEEADQRGVSTNKTTWGTGRELAGVEYGRDGFRGPYRYRLLPSDSANLPTV